MRERVRVLGNQQPRPSVPRPGTAIVKAHPHGRHHHVGGRPMACRRGFTPTGIPAAGAVAEAEYRSGDLRGRDHRAGRRPGGSRGGRAYSTRNSVANISVLGSTTGFEENYNLSLITLPNFAPLSAYLHHYPVQDPTVAFAGSCAGALLYIDTSSKLDCFNPYDGTVRNLSAPLTLLYQQTPGLSAQIDNEFQLDTPGSMALLYGNLTTAPGNVTVETVDLTNGSIHLVRPPGEDGVRDPGPLRRQRRRRDLQCDGNRGPP